MTPNFQSYDDLRQRLDGDSLHTKIDNQIESIDAVNGISGDAKGKPQTAPVASTAKRLRFELLSAYMDGELSSTERSQVEEWLATDPQVQRLHAQLLNLCEGLNAMPVPPPQKSMEQTLAGVFARLDMLEDSFVVNEEAEAISSMQAISEERFELLSAYIDGEVSAAERLQVEDWLANEPQMQRQYAQMVNLGEDLNAMSVPKGRSLEQTLENVFARLDVVESISLQAEPVAEERFELLSAYIDGEVSAAERLQVEDWLANEPQMQRQYAQMMNLGEELNAVSVTPGRSLEQTLENVFARLDVVENISLQAEPVAEERFELLSAYIDGEVSAAERLQVEDWLANEPQMQRQYAQMMNLGEELNAVSVTPGRSLEQTLENVFARLDVENALVESISLQAEPVAAIHSMKRDRFELLSAYLDGEVSAAERKQVEEWLAHDSQVKALYARLLNLRNGLNAMPVLTSQQSVEHTVEQLFARLDRRPKLRLIWGGAAAAAALFVAALSGIIPTSQSFSPQMAKAPQPAPSPESLMIALNNPIVQIPKVATVARSDKPIVSRALLVE